MKIAIVVVVMVFAPSSAAADRPEAWLFRATPGFGYSWDRASTCPIEGRMFVGGFTIGNFVTPGLLVGGSLGLAVNALPAYGCGEDALRLTTAAMIGPSIDWYPSDRGLHVFASAGYASGEQDMTTSHGIGATLGVGYDWLAFAMANDARTRLGVLAQLTAVRTGGSHATLAPALLFTVGVD